MRSRGGELAVEPIERMVYVLCSLQEVRYRPGASARCVMGKNSTVCTSCHGHIMKEV